MSFTFRAIIAAILLFANSVVFASTPHYAIVIDAGSTGSRLHIYQYDQSDKLPIIEEIGIDKTFTKEIKEGLSSYAKKPNESGVSLKPLFDAAATILQNKPATISVLGTAGMRLLTADEQAAIYQNIRDYLKSYPFTIEKPTDDIATVPEKMEGVYGWLDVNYLGHQFASDKDVTVGAIDMGGASTEITFSTRDTSRSDDEVNLSINGVHYVVFSKSFLKLGQDQARATMNENAQADACYPINYPIPPTAKIGNFNQAGCGSLYADILKNKNVAGQIPLISSKQTFVAYSGIYYDFHFLDVENTPTQATVEQAIQRECTKSWDQLKSDHPKEAEKYLANYCANSVYVSSLLFGTYQLQNGQLEVKNANGNVEFNWAMGAVLFKLVGA